MNDQKCKNIKLILFDVDGVLTDGGIIYNENGKEIKVSMSRTVLEFVF
jgi:3-deoxy-D-manno-octulosonate 8-phosphate phosphatase KdsC-like HAD superfamily phosphatase